MAQTVNTFVGVYGFRGYPDDETGVRGCGWGYALVAWIWYELDERERERGSLNAALSPHGTRRTLIWFIPTPFIKVLLAMIFEGKIHPTFHQVPLALVICMPIVDYCIALSFCPCDRLNFNGSRSQEAALTRAPARHCKGAVISQDHFQGWIHGVVM